MVEGAVVRRRRAEYWPPVWRRRPGTIFTSLVLLLSLAWARWHAPVSATSDYDRYQNQTVTCTRAIDGDTIDVNLPDGEHATTRIRLWGVDTPETKDTRTSVMYYGPEASSFTTSQAQGKSVRLVLAPEKSRDKYHRLLAYVYTDNGNMLNEEIIAQGFGYADSRFPHPWRERFHELEERAQKKKMGLWKEVKFEQLPVWRQRYEQSHSKTTTAFSE
jgi:endonuclease YncB( thermonuclease family)